MKVAVAESDSLMERAAQYAAGSMTAHELDAWEEALAEGASPESICTAEFESSLLALTEYFEPVTPPPHIRAALLEAIAPPKGFEFRFAGDGDFLPTPLPGISLRMLSRDSEHKRITCLLRLEPGAKLPEHRHSGVEECLVLTGTIFVGRSRMKAGDYQRAEANSEHVEQWTDTGALLYLSAPMDLFQ
jgi:anti-sigma factor ChrR (cupin superfamily)